MVRKPTYWCIFDAFCLRATVSIAVMLFSSRISWSWQESWRGTRKKNTDKMLLKFVKTALWKCFDVMDVLENANYQSKITIDRFATLRRRRDSARANFASVASPREASASETT